MVYLFIFRLRLYDPARLQQSIRFSQIYPKLFRNSPRRKLSTTTHKHFHIHWLKLKWLSYCLPFHATFSLLSHGAEIVLIWYCYCYCSVSFSNCDVIFDLFVIEWTFELSAHVFTLSRKSYKWMTYSIPKYLNVSTLCLCSKYLFNLTVE